jgi:small conductance mechanosensitive channel
MRDSPADGVCGRIAHDDLQSAIRLREGIMSSTLTAVVFLAFTFGIQEESSAPPAGLVLAQAAPKGDVADPVTPAKPAKLTDAERVAHLKRAIDAAKKELEKLKQNEGNPESEYRKAESKFQMLDVQWSEQAKKIQALKAMNKVKEAEELQEEHQPLKRQWEIAKERFGLLFQERKTLREKTTALQTKLKQDQNALDQLTGDAGPRDKPPANPELKKDTPKVTPNPLPGPGPVPGDPKGDKTSKGAPVAPAPMAEPKSDAGAKQDEKKPPSKELVLAKEEAKAREAAASEAKDLAKNIAERVDALRKNINLEQNLLGTARKKAVQAKSSMALLDEEFVKCMMTDPNRLPELTEQKAEAADRLATAMAAIATSQDRLNELRIELTNLQHDEIAALRDSEQKRREADVAHEKVDHLQNPFTLHNVLQWIVNHGPKILAILLGAIGLHFLVRLSSRRLAQMAARGSSRGTEQDCENRSLTLTSVVRSAAFLTILTGTLFMILDEVGIPVMPLLGGAAVLGLAVAFGAQNLIRDYFSGFMVLMEDQYGINDVVRIGDVAGVVEKITLRMTVIRDLEGIVHFIPHGTISHVSNLTHGWSRALFSICIAYKEDPRRVMQVLLDLALEMRHDPVFGSHILEDPEMLGVDNFNDSSIEIKFFLKTKPLQQWPVRRELLVRIKRRFDELGIEIPFPHRTIYHHHDRVEDHTASRGKDAGLAA